LLNFFTAEAQRTPREGAFFVCRETTTNKKTPPRVKKAGRLSSSRSLDSEYAKGACPSAGARGRLKVFFIEEAKSQERWQQGCEELVSILFTLLRRKPRV
jgi:hypothetical protein